jgi:hypothetical protein
MFPTTSRAWVGAAVPIPTLLEEKSTTRELPSTVIPPANVEVAVVEVAKKLAALAVVVATRLLFASVARSTPGPMFERVTVEPAAAVRVVPESKVRVPEV